MIAFFQRRDAAADVDDHAGTFMAEDGRENAFRVSARQCVVIGMANAGGLDFYQHFAGLWPLQINFFNGQCGA